MLQFQFEVRRHGPRHPPKDPGNPSPQYGRTYPADHLTRDEVARILARFDADRTAGLRDRALVGLLWGSGLRVSEALQLRPHDVNRERRTIRVLRGKGNKARTAGLTRAGLDLLEEWLAERDAGDDAPIFCTRAGRAVASSYVRRLLPRVAREAGVLKRVHPHILRHTFAVERAQDGMSPVHIQALLGHENLGTTDKYLKSLSPEDALDAMRDLDR